MKLFDQLRGRRLPVALVELAEEFGVSLATTRRDLKFLERAGYTFDYTYDSDHDGRTMVRMRTPSWVEGPFTRSEVHTLTGVRRLVEPWRGTQFFDDFESMYAKIMDSRPAHERAEMARDREQFFCIPDGGLVGYENKPLVEILRVATFTHRRVEFEYRSRAGNRHSGTLEPYAIGFYRNTVYLVARLVANAGEAERATIVSWPAHRFQHAVLTRHEFTVPEDFKLADYTDGWGIISGEQRERVVIEFAASVAPHIAERQWHPSQTLEDRPNGGIRLSYNVAVTSELISWIMSFGAAALVFEPTSLRDRLLVEHTRAIDHMLANFPPNPTSPKGWRGAIEHKFEDEAMETMIEETGNDNGNDNDDPSSDNEGRRSNLDPTISRDADDFAEVTETDPLVNELPRRKRTAR